MEASEAREARRLRRSLGWVGVVMLGVTLFMTSFLGFWSTHGDLGAQPGGAPPQTRPFNPWPIIVLVSGLALTGGGLVGLVVQRRFTR